MSARIAHHQLGKANWKDLVRLARWRGYFVLPGPETVLRRMRLEEILMRDFNVECMAYMVDMTGCNRPPMSGPGTVRRVSATSHDQTTTI